MQYIAQVALRLKVLPPKRVAGTGGTAQNILDDENNTSDEKTPVYRIFQNVGTNNIYYLIGATPANATVQYHGILQPLQQLDCSGHRSAVSIYAAADFTAVATLMLRTDKYGDNIITSGA